MWLTDVAIKRPIFIIMFVLALIVLGWQAKMKMPAELNPKIDFPYVTVRTMYPGAGPNEIETLVSEPIEKAVASIGNLRNVTSSSQDGISSVMLEFELGTNLDAAAADVRDKVSATKQYLPDDVEEPTILKVDIASQPIMTIGLSGPVSPKEMRILADDVISDRLAKVGGVAAVYVLGGEQREIEVAVDKDRLDAYAVSLDRITQAIRGANLNLPAGAIKEGARNYSIRTVGEFKTADELQNTRIYVGGKDGLPSGVIRLGDIATIKDTVADAEQLSRLNGKPSVTLSIQKQSDSNTVAVAEGIKEQLKEMKDVLPAGVKPIIARDDSVFVEDSINDVNKSLRDGIILVVLIVFLFLHTARATFIVATAIPTSIFAAYMPIQALGFTQNTMTLLALSLAVGILVDDSIVVLENIERHLKMRKNPSQAAADGRSEIGLAAVTITMVDIVVFIPIAFMGGIVGQFFKQFGVTVAVATAFSLFMSFTLTPMLASRWMKSEEEKERDDAETSRRLATGIPTLKDRVDSIAGRLFGGLEYLIGGLVDGYRGVLEWALHNRFMTLVIGAMSLFVVLSLSSTYPAVIDFGAPGMPMKAKVAMFVIGGFRYIVALLIIVLTTLAFLFDRQARKVAIVFAAVAVFITLVIYIPFGFTMFPEVDRGELGITIRTAPGTSLVATDRVVREVEAVVSQLPEIKPISYKDKGKKKTQQGFYITTVGASGASGAFGGSDTGPQHARIDVKVLDKRFRKRNVSAIADAINARTAHIAGAELISVTAQSGGGGGMTGITQEVQGQNMDDILKQADILAGVMRKTPGAVNVDISYKENKPERRIIVDRLRAAQLDMTVQQVAMAARTAIDGDDSAKLRDGGTEYPIRVQYAEAERNKPSDVENLIIATKNNSPIYLKDVASVVYDNAPTKIDRKNRQRVVYVTSGLATGAQLGNVQQAIDGAMGKQTPITGTTIKAGGMGKMMMESFGYMLSALALAILLVYMLMGALFESFLTPLVIMFSLPQAMVGALLALLVTGNIMSIVGMIGIIMLMGLVTKNGILLVDYTNTLRSRGKNRHDALLEAGPTRLRPILMTTLAMIGGMMPTALALNQGAEMRAPMAIAVIGGLIVSTMLTLIVIPVMYTLFDDGWHGLMRLIGKKEQSPNEGNIEPLDMDTVPAGFDENM